jgi:hypothetical protein
MIVKQESLDHVANPGRKANQSRPKRGDLQLALKPGFIHCWQLYHQRITEISRPNKILLKKHLCKSREIR